MTGGGGGYGVPLPDEGRQVLLPVPGGLRREFATQRTVGDDGADAVHDMEAESSLSGAGLSGNAGASTSWACVSWI